MIRMATISRRSSLLLVTGLLVACGDPDTPIDCSEVPQRVGMYVIGAQTEQPVCDFTWGLQGERSGIFGSSPPKCDGFVDFMLDEPDQAGNFRLSVDATGYAQFTESINISTACGRFAVSPDGPRNGHPGTPGFVTVALQSN